MKEAGFRTITYTQLAIKWAQGDTLATFGLFSKNIVHHGASKGVLLWYVLALFGVHPGSSGVCM